MSRITKRQDVVTKLAASERKAVDEAIAAVNAKLDGAKELPVVFAANELGTLRKVRDAVLKQIEEAGWRITPTQEKNETTYTIE